MNLEINLPCEIKVTDYHEFFTLERFFKLLNSKIKVKEITFSNGKYRGMAYIGSLELPENKTLLSLIKNVNADSYKKPKTKTKEPRNGSGFSYAPNIEE
jgi:hypothetical protein